MLLFFQIRWLFGVVVLFGTCNYRPTDLQLKQNAGNLATYNEQN